MSGGHWEYISLKLEEISQELNPESFKEERELGIFLKDFSKTMHDCEWYLSGDYSKEQFIETWHNFKNKWIKNQSFKGEKNGR